MSQPIAKYFKPNVAADIVLFGLNKDKLNVLLIKRKNEPFADSWALPGGHIESTDMSVDHTALRELAEETSVSGVKLRQFHTFSGPDRDPRGYSISIGYIGVIYETPKIKGHDDAKDAKWFRLDNLPKLAFDHAYIIESAHRYLSEWTNSRANLFK